MRFVWLKRGRAESKVDSQAAFEAILRADLKLQQCLQVCSVFSREALLPWWLTLAEDGGLPMILRHD